MLFLVSDLLGKTNEWQQRAGDIDCRRLAIGAENSNAGGRIAYRDGRKELQVRPDRGGRPRRLTEQVRAGDFFDRVRV